MSRAPSTQRPRWADVRLGLWVLSVIVAGLGAGLATLGVVLTLVPVAGNAWITLTSIGRTLVEWGGICVGWAGVVYTARLAGTHVHKLVVSASGTGQRTVTDGDDTTQGVEPE